jgi:hypothetical protein
MATNVGLGLASKTPLNQLELAGNVQKERVHVALSVILCFFHLDSVRLAPWSSLGLPESHSLENNRGSWLEGGCFTGWLFEMFIPVRIGFSDSGLCGSRDDPHQSVD